MCKKLKKILTSNLAELSALGVGIGASVGGLAFLLWKQRSRSLPYPEPPRSELPGRSAASYDPFSAKRERAIAEGVDRIEEDARDLQRGLREIRGVVEDGLQHLARARETSGWGNGGDSAP